MFDAYYPKYFTKPCAQNWHLNMTQDFKKIEKTIQHLSEIKDSRPVRKMYSYLVEPHPLKLSSHFVRFYFKISRSCSIVPGIYDDIFYYLYHKKERKSTLKMC